MSQDDNFNQLMKLVDSLVKITEEFSSIKTQIKAIWVIFSTLLTLLTILFGALLNFLFNLIIKKLL